MKIEELFSKQAAFVKLEKYEDELQVMRLLQGLPREVQEERRRWYLEFLNGLEKPIRTTQSAEESQKWREEGNRAFTAKPRKEDSLLTACQFYTLAIFTSPPPPPVPQGKSETLALAYANRAMALQEYGYYSQAYEDCELALEFGYPEAMVHKVLTRQAHCALKLKDKERMKGHLEALERMHLNANFKKQLNILQAGWERLKKEKDSSPPVEWSNKNDSMEIQIGVQETIESDGVKGRFMIAKQLIKQNDLIFTERASAFVPVGDNLLCQQCCSLLLVPYPCPFCNLQVVYCSLKCRMLHSSIHAHECVANQRDLFRHVGITHLAFRMVLTGLPQVAPFLAGKKDADEIWTTLMNSSDGIWKMLPLDYVQSLQMITHMDKMTRDDVLWFALVAELLLIYLQEFTVFFDFTKHVTASKIDWELIAASLILRHIGQLIVNAHTSFSLVPQRANLPYDPLYLPLFDTSIWSRPLHIKIGALHKFSDFEQVTAINLPYLSICNHSCTPSFQSKFSGCFVSTYAAKDIEAGEEIFNCYTLDCRKTMTSKRKEALKNIYKFDCQCSICGSEEPDKEHEQFHRYRCEKKDCQKIFVPKLTELGSLNWWENEEDLPPSKFLKCSICGATQNFESYIEFTELIKSDAVATDREELFESFDKLSDCLMDFNELKLILAIQLVEDCFAAHTTGSKLSNFEFAKLGKILKFYLDGVMAQCRSNSIEYVVKMTYLWDFIALGKYQCSKKDFNNMLKSVDMVSEEFRTLFLNYYEDYIKSKLTT